MKIRKAGRNDVRTLVDITYKDGCVHPIDEKSVIEYMKKGDIYWIAEINGKPVGMFKSGVNKKGNAELFIISVIIEHQGQGIGSAMLAKAESLAAEWGKNEVFIYTRQENENAQRFYKKHGYEIIGSEKDVYGPGDYFLLRKRI
jgi:ribosomal protein S18 acetylase RimI-like enzyme